MKRLLGFTLTDIIVTMIISLLITGIAFSIFRFTYNQLFSYQTEKEKYRELLAFYTTISNDFRQADEISCHSGTIDVRSLYRGDVRYEIGDDYVARTVHEIADTFHLKVSEKRTSARHQALDDGTIDELFLVIELDKKQYPFNIFKTNSLELDAERQIDHGIN